jgi:SpoVK/Ycf46/Vps4 family AAA+-type ATPase
MLLFDEMEDAMPSSYGNGEKKPRKNKAWFNRLLENTPIPTIWTSNDVQCIDNAYLRRFDIVLEMSPPDSSQRLRLLKTAFNSTHYEDAWLARVSNQLVLPPSEGSRIAKVVTLANSNAKSQVHATQLIKHSYKAIHLQVPAFDKPDLQQPIIEYQLEWLNTVCDITALCNALSTSKHGKLCLYGPPGCGKTQFAHYLAQRTGQPLLSKKASDLVSPFVGESEQNIAQLFAEAAETASILLIDEADSFFMERNAYRASWEVTMVNELLVQMEQFNGIFIASTNRIASFDPASKRRFDFKIAFDYLTHEQIVSLFCTVVDEPATVADLENAGRLRTLTPGNFLTAKRQAWLTQQPLTSTMLLTILKEESLNNPENNSRTAIGFIH